MHEVDNSFYTEITGALNLTLEEILTEAEWSEEKRR